MANAGGTGLFSLPAVSILSWDLHRSHSQKTPDAKQSCDVVFHSQAISRSVAELGFKLALIELAFVHIEEDHKIKLHRGFVRHTPHLFSPRFDDFAQRTSWKRRFIVDARSSHQPI